jgi:hypothetical protein
VARSSLGRNRCSWQAQPSLGMRGCIFALQIVNLAKATYRRRLIFADPSMRVEGIREEANTSSRNAAASSMMAFRLTELLQEIPSAISSPGNCTCGDTR